LRSSVPTRPSTTSQLKIWYTYLFHTSLRRSKAGRAQQRGTIAWPACTKPRSVRLTKRDPHRIHASSSSSAARIHKIRVGHRAVRNRIRVRARVTRKERLDHRRSRQTARDKDQAISIREGSPHPHRGKIFKKLHPSAHLTHIHRPSRNDTASPSHPQIPPRPTLNLSLPFFPAPPPQPQTITTNRTTKTGGAQLRSSYSGSPTHRHTLSSPASHRSSSSCALHRHLHLPSNLDPLTARRKSTRSGGSMRPHRLWDNGAVGRCSTPPAR
jgi:hypothetical protein